MDFFTQVQQAADFLRDRVQPWPKPGMGFVLGSGLGAFTERLGDAVAVPFAQIPNFPQSSVTGHAGELVVGRCKGKAVAVLSGRVHYYEGHDMQRVTFPVRVLQALGVRTLMVTNAAGGIHPDYKPGDFMAIADHINLTGQSPLRGPNDERLGPRFPDMTRAYEPKARRALLDAAKRRGLRVHEGVYVGLIGPAYETPAEIRMCRTLGGDAVGMSTVAEVIAANHGGMRVLGLSVITNLAAGVGHSALTHDEVKEVGTRVREPLCALLEDMAAELG